MGKKSTEKGNGGNAAVKKGRIDTAPFWLKEERMAKAVYSLLEKISVHDITKVEEIRRAIKLLANDLKVKYPEVFAYICPELMWTTDDPYHRFRDSNRFLKEALEGVLDSRLSHRRASSRKAWDL